MCGYAWGGVGLGKKRGEGRTTPLGRQGAALEGLPACLGQDPAESLRLLRALGKRLGVPWKSDPGLRAQESGSQSRGGDCKTQSSQKRGTNSPQRLLRPQ